MKKMIGLALCVVVFAGCGSTSNSPSAVVQEKAVNTTLSGTISKTGGKFFIQSTGKPTTELDSYTVKLDQYVGKKMSVTGQYSGTTLFVDIVSAQ
jgi:hypothetical protein